ncbi:MAG: hypothetical protein JXQ71_07495 [Verrucomicrobia bacterium]|nr:hypothetical protein [Verrucomicrobiota bacterium]
MKPSLCTLPGRPRWRAATAVLAVGALLAAGATLACGQTNPCLTLLRPLENGWWRLELPAQSTERVDLVASTNLDAWTVIATTHGGLRAYPDPASASVSRRFYRARLQPLTAADDGKNQVCFPEDDFLAGVSSEAQPRWIKFAILTEDPTRVYYQDSGKYEFHYEFAVARLGPLAGMTRAEFDEVSLHPTNQQVVLGAVLVPPRGNTAEFGIQLVGLEPYAPEQVARWFELVRATVAAVPGVTALYLPTFEQTAAAEAQREFLAGRGIPVSSVERWALGNAVYAPGWALGRLRFFASADVAAAHADGRLLPTDILVTDAVPAELPFVAGILSQTPATPNSHVAILARSYGVPFGHFIDPADRAQLLVWTNHEVILRAYAGYAGATLEVLDVHDQLDPALRAELLTVQKPPALDIVPATALGAYWVDTTNLVPADIRHVGGKAANYGLLRRRVPTNCQPAIAFTFDLWEAFMDQAFGAGQTLREAISNRLAHYAYPADIPALQADLEIVRDWIDDLAVFSEPLRQIVVNALSRFDPQRKIRFRSSTNVEDSEHFIGAGLYESRSGCLLDDVDGDSAGPCQCDAAEPDERGVFRALRKVYASLYNERAFLERRRYGVDEAQVGMAVLVHHSFPDDLELANGVATLTWSGGSSYRLELVTQKGAVSVAQPDGSALPEMVQGSQYGSSRYVNLEQRSSLVPWGGYVMDWTADYTELIRLLGAVADGYRALDPARTGFVLDYEYKKIVPGRLEVKQVRELPPVPATNVAPFLINQPAVWTVFQGEFGDVFANHRLKSRWHLETRNLRLTAGSLAACFYTNVTCAFAADGAIHQLTGSPADWPKAAHGSKSGVVTDVWTWGEGAARRDSTLATHTVTEKPLSQAIVTLGDFMLQLDVTHAEPVWSVDYAGRLVRVTNETARLTPALEDTPAHLRQTRSASGTNGAAVHTLFDWPAPPTGVVAGYTAPLVAFVETRIEGVTDEPLVLADFFSQTYRPGHHNFSEEFLFEPRLDPGVSAAQQAQLTALNVQYIYVRVGYVEPRVLLIGFDGRAR